jgi:hypothetical protein
VRALIICGLCSPHRVCVPLISMRVSLCVTENDEARAGHTTRLIFSCVQKVAACDTLRDCCKCGKRAINHPSLIDLPRKIRQKVVRVDGYLMTLTCTRIMRARPTIICCANLGPLSSHYARHDSIAKLCRHFCQKISSPADSQNFW